jgi:hypothetical protein
VRKVVENGEEPEERGVEGSLLASLSSKLFHDDIMYDCTIPKLS